MNTTVSEIRQMLQNADEAELEALERSLAADERKGVRSALRTARKRLEKQQIEKRRIDALYSFDRDCLQACGGSLLVGLDEVGRGAVAGPLAVGAVVLAYDKPQIAYLNDSKQLTPQQREETSIVIKETALCWSVCYVEPARIDEQGMSASLRDAFSGALAKVEALGFSPDVVLVDGNPLGIDERETNVIKGDAKSAAIAAASIIAKVERDALMRRLDSTFPQYGFFNNKGYAAQEHIDAIREHGLSSVHRASFCKSFMQESLF